MNSQSDDIDKDLNDFLEESGSEMSEIEIDAEKVLKKIQEAKKTSAVSSVQDSKKEDEGFGDFGDFEEHTIESKDENEWGAFGNFEEEDL